MTDLSNDHGLPHRRPFVAGIAALLARPRSIAAICIVALAVTGWLYLGIMAGLAPASDTASYLTALCRPAFTGASAGLETLAYIFPMWVAMTLAMMLPSAGPMILTYCEIAETAARKGEAIVSPLVLMAGYLSVWLGFAVGASALQLGLIWIAEWRDLGAWAMPAAAALFVLAGAYQFSALKSSCLSACQRPFPFFFMNWTDKPRGVFRLGIHQGRHCVGCCWAMMLLMLITGAMNVVWMAVLGLIMVIEKMTTTARFSRAVGVSFIAAGGLIVAAWLSGMEKILG